MNKFFSLFFLSFLFLSTLNYCSQRERDRIYNSDAPEDRGKHYWRYFYKMDPGAVSTDEAITALKALNENLSNNDRKLITITETPVEINVIINQLDTSNQNCGEDVLLPLKRVTMPKHAQSFDTPAHKTFYKKLFIKRLREIAQMAREIKPYDYYSFQEKMAFDWHYEIKPSIQAEVARYMGDEISETIIANWFPNSYTPSEVKSLVQKLEENAERTESLSKTVHALNPLIAYANIENPNKRQKKEFQRHYLHALDLVHEELTHA